MTCAIAAAVLATALSAVFQPGLAGAQTAESDAGERKAEGTEETASDSGEATPTAAEASPAKASKPISKPFEPSERIEAESVISFPENI